MKSRLMLVVIAMVSVISMLGAVQAQPARPEVRVRLQFARPRDLDPVQNTRAADYYVYFNIFSHLVRWQPGKTELEPDLAERWASSPDATVWTFFLRKGVQFHKGYGELTAEDVKFTFDRFSDKAVATPNAGNWEAVNSVDVVDRYTVRITLKEPNVAFVASRIASHPAMIVSKKAVLDKGKAFSRDPIGTGPFIFQQWTSADEITVVANDRYFRGAPKVRQITFVPIEEEAVAVAALERGAIHAMWSRGSAEALPLLRANKELTVEVVRRPGLLRVLSINPQYAPLADARVRKALAYAINKKELELASGGQMVATSHLLPNLPWLQEAAAAGKFPVYNNDPARAKKLLTEAGHAQLKVTLLFQLESPSPLIAQVLAEQFRRVGIDVTLEGLEQRAWNIREREARFQLTTLGLGRGSDPDEMARDLLHTSNFPPGNNSFRYDRADALIAAGARERDPARRRQLYMDLMKQVLTDLPYIPLVNDNLISAWRAPIRRVVTGIDNDFPGFTIEVSR